MNKKLTDKQINEIKRMRQKGAKYKELAEKFGVSVTCISYHAKGIKATKKKPMKVAKKVGVKRITTTTTEAYYDDSPKVVKKIHRRGNELYNVEVKSKRKRKTEKHEVEPVVHPDKVETTNAVLWLMLAACAAILVLGLANL